MKHLTLVIALSLVTGVASADPNNRARSDTRAGAAILAGSPASAVAWADRAIADNPADGWARYDRAVALAQLGRTDEAVQSYIDAEARFAPDAWWPRSLAIYGRLRVLETAGRCEESISATAQYAALVRPYDPARAARVVSQAVACRLAIDADPAVSEVTSAVISGQYKEALALADALPYSSGWLDYDRGVALGGLGRTDQAVAAFRRAESRFGSDEYGRSIAIWGGARVLDAAGRCGESKLAFDRYARLVEHTDPDGARMATARAVGCRTVPSPDSGLVAAR